MNIKITLFVILVSCLIGFSQNQELSIPESRKLSALVHIKNDSPILISDEKEFAAFCKKNKINQQKVDFKTEFVFVEKYCCSSHTRRGPLNLRFEKDNNQITLGFYATTANACRTRGEPRYNIYAIKKHNAKEFNQSGKISLLK